MKIHLQIPKGVVRGVTASLFLATAMVSYGQEAQKDIDPNSPYVNKSYQYYDKDGNLQSVPYLQRVTDLKQMQALVVSVFVDKTIPGQKKVIGQSGTEEDVQYRIISYRTSGTAGKQTISSWDGNGEEGANTTHYNHPNTFGADIVITLVTVIMGLMSRL